MTGIAINNQKGAALIVGLIVLLVLTILGLASMGSMSTELKIASNLQDHNNAFQAAESGIIEVKNSVVIDWNVIDTSVVQTANYVAPDNSMAAVATVTYSDCRNYVIGSSLKVGSSWKGLVHEIRSTGTSYNTGGTALSESVQIQGVQTPRPGC